MPLWCLFTAHSSSSGNLRRWNASEAAFQSAPSHPSSDPGENSNPLTVTRRCVDSVRFGCFEQCIILEIYSRSWMSPCSVMASGQRCFSGCFSRQPKKQFVQSIPETERSLARTRYLYN